MQATSCLPCYCNVLIIMGLDHLQILWVGFQGGLHGNENLTTNPVSFQWVAQQLPKGPNPNGH